MKRITTLVPFALAAAIGCQGQPDSISDGAPADLPTTETVTTEDGSAITFVSLKVPNMH